jgi:Nif-specific regulatory protein
VIAGGFFASSAIEAAIAIWHRRCQRDRGVLTMASHRIPFESVSAAERSRLLADNDRLRQQLRDRHRLADFAGNSRAIRRVGDLIAQVAPSTHSVCLTGEDGVGKTRAARAIHNASPRSARPFISVSCSSMLEADLEAQLFGSSESAGLAAGCAVRAEGGTLLFDDVADLGPLAQHTLIRLVKEGTWDRPDGVQVPADVRVIAVTTHDLRQEAALARGRRDLWEHLGALTIQIPPLRERKADLPVLTDLFVEQFAREHVRGVRSVSTRAMDMLMNYDWPGNVGQLRQTIERAVVLTTGPIIHHHHLPTEIQTSGDSAVPMLGLSEALEAYEKELLQDALRQAKGIRSHAARLLMTSERVFSYRLRKHRIDTRRFRSS